MSRYHPAHHRYVSADRPEVVLKNGELFYVQYSHAGHAGAGLYYRDTRFWQFLGWQIGHETPIVLSASVYDGSRAQIDFTNPEMVVGGQVVPAHHLHLRATILVADRLYYRLRLTNFAGVPLPIVLRAEFAADFRDIFEVRGAVRPHRGELESPVLGPDRLRFRYRGLDGLLRETEIRPDPAPDAWDVPEPGRAAMSYRIQLEPHVKVYRCFGVAVEIGGETPSVEWNEPRLGRVFAAVALRQARANRAWIDQCTHIETDNAIYNGMLRQATLDMRALLTTYPGEGQVIEAGIPWYVAPFGRDACITGIETLLLNPDIAKSSLRFLARFQGTAINPWRDEEPGKILHELRRGEMARCGEIPHTPYYGSVDSTLWWIIALYETWLFTQDRNWLLEFEEPLRRAYRWILSYGDRDGDGLIEYARQSPRGLFNQGWKDSEDAVLDETGRPLTPPIALVEVQGYAYYALNAAAALFAELGDWARSVAAREAARQLQAQFQRYFWLPKLGTYAFALDAAKRPVSVATSNMGHLLFTGILPPEQVQPLVRRLLRPDLASGFGIRTLSTEAPFYNPISYHNGTVWPHDNALIAWGFKVAGARQALAALGQQLYEAANYFEGGRLPELYCGFHRQAGNGPVHYPVACDPQAWSAAVPFFFLRLFLGLSVRERTVYVVQPMLPPWTRRVVIEHLEVAGSRMSLEFLQNGAAVSVNVLAREGHARLVIQP
ncbi:MAG: amylo-alpha-1,6-glucosidase [Firmicutes bacterium]|nr:amylo-alpha-1,6-glucosidase [Alicyclobacillaceae bacterium]MCL6496082.1 amylo-alpha-1,6-glucosidase [Bacillota bacterium]